MNEETVRKLDRIVQLLTIIAAEIGLLVALVMLRVGLDSVIGGVVLLVAAGVIASLVGSAIGGLPAVRE